MVVNFQTFSAIGGCTVELFTTRNRSTRHADASAAQSCSRASSVIDGTRVTYVFGAVADLTASTTYFYRITDGSRVMVGEFVTAATGSAAVNVTAHLYDAAAYDVVVESSVNADMSSPNVSAPVLFLSSRASILHGASQGSVMYHRFKYRDNAGAVLRTTNIRAVVAP